MIETFVVFIAGIIAGYCVKAMQSVEREREQLVTRINLRRLNIRK